MPLEFLTRMATANLPLTVTSPRELKALQQCIAAGYLEAMPLTTKKKESQQTIVAARVLAILPEGVEAMRCFRENAQRSGFQPLA